MASKSKVPPNTEASSSSIPPGGRHQPNRSHHAPPSRPTNANHRPNAEGHAIMQCLDVLEPLPADSRQRVLAYMGNKFSVSIPWPETEAALLTHVAAGAR